ncbi:MAG TPA: alkaline phosphatase PhoX [Flavisolibacter sp.]|nr:alkaline phosphatase PhoX [Flavisolibacter sp.]
MKCFYKVLTSAFLLCLFFSVPTIAFAQISRTQVFTPAASADDAEECVPGGSGTPGAMDLTSSDLEIMLDGTKKQMIGIRFTDVTIPQGATIHRAYIQFSNKGDKAPVLGDAYITAQDTDNALSFTATAFNITSRTGVAAPVLWAGSTSATWGTAAGGAAGAEQRTPDLKTVIQPVVNRAGWATGNALVVLLTGEGVRNTFSFDGAAASAPKLIIEYASPSIPAMAVASFPIAAASEWKYLDNGSNQGPAWAGIAFNDAGWSYGTGKLGYSDNPVTTLAFGPDAVNKYITYYFRKQFSVINTASLKDSIQLNLLRDDGAIVYINGIEVARSNMPAGAVDFRTFSSAPVDGADEATFFTYRFSKNALVNGTNTIAVEIHQRDGADSDLGFDASLTEYSPPLPLVVCAPVPGNHISAFVSVLPSAQPDSLRIPSSHTFQMIVQSGDPYTNPADGVTKSLFDFTGYVPISGSSRNGYLSINHEGGGWPDAGVSMLNINFNSTNNLWNVTQNAPVDFGSTSVAGTARNCSGTVTPWNTIITCEETLPTADVNADGYQDVGWAVEIDPATHTVMDHDNDGQPDKLWKLGRMSHENVVVTADGLTVYEGNDENPGFIYKLVADVPGKLGAGTLYVLKLTGTPDNSTGGSWIQVPNGTPAECNNVRAFAASVSATNFNSIEDVEISPKDGKIYFTSKAISRVYRFKDNGSTVDQFDIFVGNAGSIYNINYGTGTAPEQWRDGNDNLTFDDEGNLYVIQDGGRNHVWMVRPCHTAASPAVELFAVTPAGSEPTGMTFSPDYKFMFLSIQHPSGTNATQMTDAAGNAVRFNKESAIVIARKDVLGPQNTLPVTFTGFNARRNSNSTISLEWQFLTDEPQVKFEVQRMADGGNFETIHAVTTSSVTGNGGYTYTDAAPFTGKNFYRIKATVRNGKEVLTNIKVISVENKVITLVKTFPNPVANEFTMMVESSTTKPAQITVYNTVGATAVLQQKATLVSGSNTVQVDTKALPAGTYFVQLVCGDETIKTKLVKQ